MNLMNRVLRTSCRFVLLASILLLQLGGELPNVSASQKYLPPLYMPYNGPPLVWPFASEDNWKVTQGYNTIYHGGNGSVPGNHGDKFTFDLVRAMGVTQGQVVYAAQDGQVWYGGWIFRVKDSNQNLTNYYVMYGHLIPDPGMKAGVNVQKGQRIGVISSSPPPDGQHLHFGIALWGGQGNPSPRDFPDGAGWVPVALNKICGSTYPFNGTIDQYKGTIIEPCGRSLESTTIKAGHSGKCLRVKKAGLQNTATIVQNECTASARLWRLKRLGDYYLIINVRSGKCLDVPNAAEKAVWQWDCHRGTNQQWKLVSTGGSYRIKSRFSGRCLDVNGASQSNGAQVIQWPCNGGPNQKFRLTVPYW